MGTFAFIPQASAKILRTKPSASSSWSTFPLTFGSGFEFETDSQETIYDFPLLLEYNFLEELKFSIEPNFAHIDPKTAGARSVTGMGDLETTLEFEFLSETDFRPAISAEGVVKWPTASDSAFGTGNWDYSIGLIASKDLLFVDLNFEVFYTFVGSTGQRDTLEFLLSVKKQLNHIFELEGEVVTSIGMGSGSGQSGTLSRHGAVVASENEFEGLLGLAEHVNKRLKLEEGVIIRNDLSWQFVIAWEWSFLGKN